MYSIGHGNRRICMNFIKKQIKSEPVGNVTQKFSSIVQIISIHCLVWIMFGFGNVEIKKFSHWRKSINYFPGIIIYIFLIFLEKKKWRIISRRGFFECPLWFYLVGFQFLGTAEVSLQPITYECQKVTKCGHWTPVRFEFKLVFGLHLLCRYDNPRRSSFQYWVKGAE